MTQVKNEVRKSVKELEHFNQTEKRNFLKDCSEEELITMIINDCNSNYSEEYLKSKNKKFLIDFIIRFSNNEKWEKAIITNEHQKVFDLIKEYVNQSKKTYRYNNPISQDKSCDIDGDLAYIDTINFIDTFVNNFNINDTKVNNFSNRMHFYIMHYDSDFGFQIENDNKVIEVYAYKSWDLRVFIAFYKKENDVKDVVDIEHGWIDKDEKIYDEIILNDSRNEAINENLDLYYRKVENLKDINDKLFNQINKIIAKEE